MLQRTCSSRDKVRLHRERLRAQGLRPVQILVPDVTTNVGAALGCLQHRSAHRLRQLRGYEGFLGVKIILSRFINHAKLAQLLGTRIGNGQINLAPLQRHFVAGIIDANNQSSRCSSHMYSPQKEALYLEFPLPDPSGLVPVYLGPDNLAAS